jgi:hypothetical protein
MFLKTLSEKPEYGMMEMDGFQPSGQSRKHFAHFSTMRCQYAWG